MLASYLSDTALLLNDPSNQFWSQSTLTTIINRARRWISVRCFFPQVLVTGLQTVGQQEAYPLSLADSTVTSTPGVASSYGLLMISSQQANYFPALGRDDFASYLADWKILNGTLQNYPYKFSTFGRGSKAVVYLGPVPAAAYEMWWLMQCLPINLSADTDVEAIPVPWTDIVPWKAAAIANATQQRWTDMQALDGAADTLMMEASRAEMPFVRPTWYPNPG